MKSLNTSDSYAEWLKTRPENVQRLATEFPIGTTLELHGETWHLLGYTEGDDLIISRTDPYDDYDGAHASKQYVCAKHFRP